jgi:hypothetical protein
MSAKTTSTNTEQEPISEKTLNAVKANASNLRWERENQKEKTDKLFAIIIREAGERGIREAYAEIDHTISFPYYAFKGEWTTAKGRKMTAWLSAYGKFAGKIKKDDPDNAPILNGYKTYGAFKPDDLLWDAKNKKFKIINHTTQSIYFKGDWIEVKLAY